MTHDYCDEPTESTTRLGLHIKRYKPDHNDFAWSTLMHLIPDVFRFESNPGRPEVQETVFRMVMAQPGECGLHNAFANPTHGIWADASSMDFIEAARTAQINWFKQFRTIMHSSGRVKRELKQMSPIIRELSHTGVLIADGRHVFPNAWPQYAVKRSGSTLVGRLFGRLTVMEMRPRMTCLCQCQCGTLKMVRRQHLLSGRTNSCGCLRKDWEARTRTTEHSDTRT